MRTALPTTLPVGHEAHFGEAAVAAVVAVVAHEEIVPVRHHVVRSRPTDARRCTARGDAPRRAARCRSARAACCSSARNTPSSSTGCRSPLTYTRLSRDHDVVARQADQALDVVRRRIGRQAEHDHVAALRLAERRSRCLPPAAAGRSANLLTKMKSPSSSVGIIESEGIRNGSNRNERISSTIRMIGKNERAYSTTTGSRSGASRPARPRAARVSAGTPGVDGPDEAGDESRHDQYERKVEDQASPRDRARVLYISRAASMSCVISVNLCLQSLRPTCSTARNASCGISTGRPASCASCPPSASRAACACA